MKEHFLLREIRQFLETVNVFFELLLLPFGQRFLQSLSVLGNQVDEMAFLLFCDHQLCGSFGGLSFGSGFERGASCLGLDGVLYSIPMSDILTEVISAILIVRTYKQLDRAKKGTLM